MRVTKGYKPHTELNFKSSVANLNPIINVNGLDGTTILRYNGKFADSSIFRPWGYGETLGIASSGDTPTLNDGSPLLGAYDDSVKFNGGEVYQADNSAFADITTEDFYIDGLLKTPASIPARQVIFAKSASGGLGFYIRFETNGQCWFVTYGAGGLYLCYYSSALALNASYYFSWFLDASETTEAHGLQLYLNNLNSTAYTKTGGLTPATIGSLSNLEKFTLGSYSGFGSKFNSSLAYLLMAKRSNWFAGGAQNLIDWAALHEERFAQLTATYPVIGTSLPEHTRNSPAFLRKDDGSGNITYHLMGAGWPRTSKLIDANGVEFIGAENEESDDEFCLDSVDINEWTKSNVTTPSSIDSPLKGFPAYAVVESVDGGSTLHAIYPSGNSLSSSDGQIFVVYFVIAANDETKFRFVQVQTDTRLSITYDISSGVASVITNNTGGTPTYGQYSLGTFEGKEFKLVWFKFISSGGGGTTRPTLYTCNSSGDIFYQGDGSTCFYVAYAGLRIYPSTQDPYLLLEFNESSGSDVSDSSGNSRDQTLVGDSSSFWVTGRDGNAGYFDGSVPNYISLPVTYFDGEKGAWGCWVKVDWGSIGSNARIFAAEDSNGSNYEHRTYYSGGILKHTFANGSTTVTIEAGSPANNVWQHVVFAWHYDGSTNTTLKAYLNGSELSTDTIAGPLVEPDTGLYIGKWDVYNLLGYIDDFVLYQRYLQPDDVTLLYEQGALKDRSRISSPIVTTTATVTRAVDVLEYEYSNDLTQGSKVFDFVKPATPSVDTNIFTISDGTDDNKIYAYVDSDGYLNAKIIYGGSSEGIVQIATDICTDEKKRIAIRWKDTLEILVYDYHTQEIETDSTAISNVPTNLTTNEFESGNFIIGSSKDYEYYENSNSRLLFS